MHPPHGPIPSPAGRLRPAPAGGPPPAAAGERGIALLLVLLLSLILLPFAASFTTQVNYESVTALNVTEQLMIENGIDGQFEVVLARLRYDAGENEVDTYDDGWNSQELRERKDEKTEVALETHVWDEQAKLNLRLLGEGPPERRQIMKERFRRLLMIYRRDTPDELGESEAEAWADAVFEYLNGGAARGNIPKPRMVDDRPILVLEELTFLPKVRDQRFDFLLQDQRDGDKVSPGLHRFVTVYGTGRLNLNTVPQEVLEACFGENPELAERIVERRENPPEEEEEDVTFSAEEEDTKEVGNPYTDVSQVNEVEGVTQKALADNKVDLAADFDTRTDFFSVRIVGETPSTRRDELFVVQRVPGPTPEDPIEGFRFLLRQERSDPLETLDAQEE